MKRYNDWKIGTRILVGFLIAIIIAGIIGGVGILGIRMVGNSYALSYTDSVMAMQYTERISSSFQRIRMNVYALILAETPADKANYRERLDDFKVIIDDNIVRYREMLAKYDAGEMEEELRLIDAVQGGLTAYGAEREVLIEEVGMDPSLRDEAFAQIMEGGLRALALEVDDSITDLINYNIDYSAMQIDDNERQTIVTTIAMVACLAVGIVLSVLLALFISRGISKRIELLLEASDRLALGDINVQVKADSKDEIGELMKSFGNMVANTRQQAMVAEKIADGDLTVAVEIKSEYDLLGQKLHELVEKNNEMLMSISIASDQVAAGSDQVAAGAQALSQGATEQASSVEELTATIIEVSQELKDSADNAQQAKQLSLEAGRETEESNRQMHGLRNAMEEITQTSREIGKIIKTIDDIAFQTNILALNAAVEAARAGAAGKGFAVVADEVRNLAGKSAEAAKSTTELIESTLVAIENGSKLTDETAKSLHQVAEKVQTVDGKMNQIAEDIEKQSVATNQIASGINQVSAVVQTNSATAEESAAASEELSGQAMLLKEHVSKYKLKQGRQAAPQSGYQSAEYKEYDAADKDGHALPHGAYGNELTAGQKKLSLAGGFGKY